MARDRNSALFIGVSLVAGFGGNALSLVAGVWALDLTHSSSLAALVGMFVYIPSVFGPILGALVDRLPRRKLLIWTNLLTSAMVLTLLALRDPGRLWLLYTVMLGYGISHVLLDAGESALLAAAVPADGLGSLNGLRMSAQEGMKLVAPLVGAGLFTWAGGSTVAVLTASTLVVSAALYGFVRASPEYPAKENKWREGFRYLWRHRTMRTLVLAAGGAVAVSGMATAALYTVVVSDLHQKPAFVGVLGSAQGAGSILGGLLAGKVRNEAVLCALGAALFGLGFATRFVPVAAVVVAGSVVQGIGLPWTVIAAYTFVQRQTDPTLLGRVAGTAGSFIFAPVALAIPAGAGLLNLVGHRAAIMICLATCGALAWWALDARSRSREAR